MRQGLADEGFQSTVLPVEIGFLAHHGYPLETLRHAAILAERAGVPADELLLKGGLIGEHEFYRALAAELDLPFVQSPRLSPRAVYPAAILTGIAPAAEPEGGIVMAPRGASLTHLLRNRRPGGSLRITSPSLLARAVFRAQSCAIAHRAAHDLPDKTPEFSSRDGISIPQIAASGIVVAALSFGLYLAPAAAIALLAATLSPLFLGMVVLRLAATILHNPVEPALAPPRVEDAALPVYTVIVALYRERRVASRLIDALGRLDYPAAKLDIKLVLEADDRETLDALAGIRMPGFIEVIVAPPGQPRTKPRALNVALPLARGQLTAIYDAEDVPDPGQLRMAAAALARVPPDVACVQARLTIDNTDDSWLTRLFTVIVKKQPCVSGIRT